MRLLHVTDFRLAEFADHIPPYAILSHTWELEEVVFSDLDDLAAAKTKHGFEKLRNACRQAAIDNIQWIWIDTCCIDKSSSAELSEAINSMFSWYRKSVKCYAYLSDVGDVENMKRSRWFTRAWTLQELLAPKEIHGQPDQLHDSKFYQSGMEFFGKDWKKLGTRISLGNTISEATGIATDFLTGQYLYTASISMRMSWAAERNATRAEDIAYSLLGIFDVNMPLLYGEGKAKAFRRLQQEIMHKSDDETLFAWESLGPYTPSQSVELADALASDPKDFGEAADLVPYAPNDPIIPHIMTHRGLHIEVQIGPYGDFIRPIKSPIMIKSPVRHEAAVLRCHLAHDFANVVVIPLKHVTANLYVRDTSSSIGLLPTSELVHFSPLTEVYISGKRTPAAINSVRRRFAVLISSLPHHLEIVNVTPSRFWHFRDRILQGELTAQGLRSWHAAVELRFNDAAPANLRQRTMFVALGCRQEDEDDPVRPWLHVNCEPRVAGLSSLRIYENEMLSPLNRSCEATFFEAPCEEPHGPLSISVERRDVFGQVMFVAHIKHKSSDAAHGLVPASTTTTKQMLPPLESIVSKEPLRNVRTWVLRALSLTGEHKLSPTARPQKRDAPASALLSAAKRAAA